MLRFIHLTKIRKPMPYGKHGAIYLALMQSRNMLKKWWIRMKDLKESEVKPLMVLFEQ